MNPEILIQPITPEEVIGLKKDEMPAEVTQAFNSLLGEKVRKGHALIRQDDAVARMVEMGLDSAEIYEKGWLDIEDMYREAGWEVSYDRPGFNESYAATFKFRAKS